MQLPRGKFREIKKNVTIESILTELEQTRFYGICTISSGPATGTLVFNRGTCILVKFQGKSGDAGWTEVQKSVAEEVDAALSTLDDAQVQLSLEFNKACKLVKAGRTAPQSRKPAPPQRPEPVHHEPVRKTVVVHHAAPPAAPVKIPPKPAAVAPVAPHPAAPHKAPPALHADARREAPGQASQIPPAPRVPAQRAEEPKTVVEEDLSSSGQVQGSFEKDIDTFDSLDLENVTDKIRNDCKTMIKQLHLEHLMER